jgi:hypothetical protein
MLIVFVLLVPSTFNPKNIHTALIPGSVNSRFESLENHIAWSHCSAEKREQALSHVFHFSNYLPKRN